METRVDHFWDLGHVETSRGNNGPRTNQPGPGTEEFSERVRSTPNRLVTTEATLTLNDEARNYILQETTRTDQDMNGVSNM